MDQFILRGVQGTAVGLEEVINEQGVIVKQPHGHHVLWPRVSRDHAHGGARGWKQKPTHHMVGCCCHVEHAVHCMKTTAKLKGNAGCLEADMATDNHVR